MLLVLSTSAWLHFFLKNRVTLLAFAKVGDEKPNMVTADKKNLTKSKFFTHALRLPITLIKDLDEVR